MRFAAIATVAIALMSGAQPADSNGTDTLGSCARPKYRVIPIPFIPNAINDSTTIVGSTIFHHAAVWTSRTGVQELTTPKPFHFAEAVSINNSDEIIVNAMDAEGSTHQAFLYSRGTFTALAGSQPIARGINDSHLVVGEATSPGDHVTKAVTWVNRTLYPVNTCCGSSMKGVNKTGTMIGDQYDAQSRYHAFWLRPGEDIQSIGPDDRYSSAIAINDAGHVILQAFPDVYLFTTEGLKKVQLSKSLNRPRAISNCDVVLGSFGPYSDKDRAFIWDETQGFRDLNDLIPADSEWKLEAAVGMNARGEIIGRGDHMDGEDQGFLLIPDSG
jgi:uncharacterized membrane protein